MVRFQKGFTLVEIAIVMVIIGILVSGGAAMVAPLTKLAKYRQSKDIVASAMISVTGFAALRGSLPTQAAFPSNVRKFNDGWDRPLQYLPDSGLTAGNLCGRGRAGLSVNICPDAACAGPTTIADVAFIIASGGGNFNMQTASVAGAVKVYPVGLAGIDDYAADMDRADEYDDIVDWMTLGELRVKAGCNGPQLSILNSVLPTGNAGASYSAEIFPEGGVPFLGNLYRWCIQTTTGSLPSWISVNPSATPVRTNCSAEAEGGWAQRSSLLLSGTAEAAVQKLTIYVRDNDDTAGNGDNVASRGFVLTVN